MAEQDVMSYRWSTTDEQQRRARVFEAARLTAGVRRLAIKTRDGLPREEPDVADADLGASSCSPRQPPDGRLATYLWQKIYQRGDEASHSPVVADDEWSKWLATVSDASLGRSQLFCMVRTLCIKEHRRSLLCDKSSRPLVAASTT